MNSMLTVIRYTIKDMIKRKSFIISTLIILILIVVGFNIPNLISNLDEPENSKVLIVDKENIFEDNLEILKESNIGYDITLDNKNDDEIKKEIENEDIDFALVFEQNNEGITIHYIVTDGGMFTTTPDDLITAISSIYTNMQIEKLNLSPEQIMALNPNFNLSMEPIGEEVNGNLLSMMMLSIVLFYAIYFCAYQVSSSITTEKTSKIIETLVTSTSPKTIVLGKTIGIGLVGLFQLVLIVGTALISANIFLDKEIINAILDVSSITPYLGIITIIYFILGYFAFALLYALTGSTVSKPEDIQSANTPVAIISVACFYLSYFTMMNPNSSMNNFASLFPLSAPFCMPFRVMMGLASPIDVIISIIILTITILVIAKITIRIYSNAIINYGTKLSIKDLINIYKSK